MKTVELRSDCPINATLQVVGDAWSLLIVRDMVYFGKNSFTEFAASDEGIARNILTARLSWLTDNGVISKQRHPTDGRREIYRLTEKGLDLIPILLDMAEWGSAHAPTSAPEEWLAYVRLHRAELIPLIRRSVQAGGSIFEGPRSVMAQIQDAPPS